MVRIIGDTTSGLTLEQAQQYGIELIPQIIIFGEESYRDDTEITSAEFVKKLEASKELPKTAAPPPALYTPIYQDIQEKGDSAIVICPSLKVSGTVRSATNVLADFPGLDVRIIDSQTIACPLAMELISAKKWADEGKSIDEIEALVKDLNSRIRFFALVDTLEYLHRGGRIGGAAKLFGEVLQIKPILHFVDGQLEVFEKQRTKKKALARIFEIVEKECLDPKAQLLSISIADTHPDKDTLLNDLKARFKTNELPILQMPPGIMVHAGPNVIVIAYILAD